MGNFGEVDPVELASAVVEKSLDSEPVRNLLGPLTKNIGIALGQVGDIARFYTEENLARIFRKWEQQRKGKPLDAESFRRILPLLRDAAMQSDDELQERWAALLENVANQKDGVLPSFGQILSQLTPQEARYLDQVWEFVTQPNVRLSAKREGREELGYHSLIEIYDPNLDAPGPAEMRVHKSRMSSEELAAFDRMTNFELILHDLERLGLLEKQMEYVSGDPSRYKIGYEEITIPSVQNGMKTSYALTVRGELYLGSPVQVPIEG